MTMPETQKMYRATSPLYVGRARAHEEGDLLTEAQVERGGWQVEVQPAGEANVVEPGARPANSATKAEWVAYATHADRGADQLDIAHADSLKKDELVDLIG